MKTKEEHAKYALKILKDVIEKDNFELRDMSLTIEADDFEQAHPKRPWVSKHFHSGIRSVTVRFEYKDIEAVRRARKELQDFFDSDEDLK